MVSKITIRKEYYLLRFLSKVIKNAGRSIKFEIIPINKVIETKLPKYIVPLKFDAAKIPNPKNKIIAV